ncbi:MAG: tRNA (guanosine(46)-N7)-methyltransferase TrmB [Candidatus Riflebacteria bacterium]|nr:tRNA (guanosine(46)-N7)-methyltransferase TrmB [Candidatus Riflebacteria bacterium]
MTGEDAGQPGRPDRIVTGPVRSSERRCRKRLDPDTVRTLPDGTDVIVDLSEWPLPLGLEKVFGSAAPVALEIGPGKGEFILEMAKANPGMGFLAVEYKRTRVERIGGRVVRAGVTNVRLTWSDARILVTDCLPPASLVAVYMNFPDPWPKRRHRRRRLAQAPFLESLARVVVPGGTFTLGTDVEDYATQVVGALELAGTWENVFGRARIVDRIEGYGTTHFERRFREQGVAIHFLRYRRL